jgi:hypothetical protein
VTASVLPGPGIAKAYPALSATDGPSLKREAIRLQPLTGMSKRECWKQYEGGTRGWTTIQRYFDANYPKSYPTTRFVQWLKLRADRRQLEILSSEFEAAR